MFFYGGFPFLGIILLFMVFGLTMRVLRRFFIRSNKPRVPNAFHLDDGFFLSDVAGYPVESEGLESRIYKLAYEMKGRLTLSDLVIGTNMTIKQSEEVMNRLVDGSHIRMEVDDDGTIVYEFPELKKRLGAK